MNLCHIWWEYANEATITTRAGMVLLLGPLEFQSVVFGVFKLRASNCEWRKSLVFAGVGTCLQVLLAGSEYFVIWNSFMSHPTQYCEAVVLRFLKERGYQ
jgi:hypothetical protein